MGGGRESEHMSMHVICMYRSPRTTFGNWFFSPTQVLAQGGGWGGGLKLRLPGLVASTFAHWAISLAPNFKS